MHYSKLDAWIYSMDLAVNVYELTEKLPPKERFGLASQMERAAVSIPSNVAEGEGRESFRDRSRYYLQARGSLYELETQVMLCQRLGYVQEAKALMGRTAKVGQVLNGMLRSLKRRKPD